MKPYNDLAIISLFIKRKKLFLISLCICLILGSFWTHRQVKALQQEQISYHDQQANPSSEMPKIGFIQYNNYGKISLSEQIVQNILLDFYQKDIISDFRKAIDTPFFTTYAIFYTADNPTKLITKALESNPATQEVKTMLKSLLSSLEKDEAAYAKMVIENGFFSIIDEGIPYIEDPSKPPINKHYIHLDKNRLAQKGYSITSTEIIKNHQSLNSNKIWIFMIICSIMISVFAVFLVENFTNLRKQIQCHKPSK